MPCPYSISLIGRTKIFVISTTTSANSQLSIANKFQLIEICGFLRKPGLYYMQIEFQLRTRERL